MSYHSKSISEIIDNIEQSKAFLPAIQRKFVWPRWKIENLFDSLMRNYPIGSFLFWELNKEKATENGYVFYNFLKNYDERNPYNTRKTGAFRHEEIIGVLDGQQRLSSLFLGLMGTHRARKKYKKGLGDNSFPETSLYLNLLSLPYSSDEKSVVVEDRDTDFEFRFLTPHEASLTERRTNDGQLEPLFWFKVGNVLDYPSEPDIDNEYEKIINSPLTENQTQRFIETKRFIKIAILVYTRELLIR